MGTFTPNLNLYKPADAETGWGANVRTSIDTLDTEVNGRVKTTGGGKETRQAHGTITVNTTVDLANGNWHTMTLGASLTLTFTGATSGFGCSFVLIVTQDATGSRVITWPASVKWNGGAAPVLSTAASAVDVLSFSTVDGGTTWYGFLGGKGMA